MSILHESARQLLGYHLSVIPAKDKKPTIKWANYQNELMTLEEVHHCFNGAPQLAIICGKVSGNLEVMDFDLKYDEKGTVWSQFKELVDNADEHLLPLLVMQKTISGGVHILYRCEVIEGNQKLAKRQDKIVLIETRGEGGYIVAAPSEGYKILDGQSFANIPTITIEQRQILHSAARSLNQMVSDHTPSIVATGGKGGDWEVTPGDAFDEVCDMEELLTSFGWTVASRQGQGIWFLRPGDSSAAHSANWNVIPNRFWCWSTSTAFDAEKVYKPYAVYAVLACGGDYSRAAAELYAKGYGKKKPGTEEQEILKLALKDEAGLAELFSRLYEGKALHDHNRKDWRFYEDGIWRLDEKKEIVRILYDSLQKELFKATQYLTLQIKEAISIGDTNKSVELQSTQKSLYKQAASLNKRKTIENVAGIARSLLPVLATQLDQAPHLINLGNGTFDCKNYQFGQHSPKDMLSKKMPFDYDPEATCPNWLEFLDTIFQGDQDLISFIQRAIGYTLTGLSDLQAILFCYGSGGNGKTIFFSVLEMMMGEFYVSLGIDLILARQKTAQDDYHMSTLKGARCVVTSEIPEGRRLNESQVKDLTGGDPILARIPGGIPFSFKPTHTLWMFGNHKPIITGIDNGIWRRMYLIPFLHTIPKENRKDKTLLMQRFRFELPGIFNWAMEGLRQYASLIPGTNQLRGLDPPEAVTKETDKYKEESNNFKNFINQRCEPFAAASVKVGVLYNTYVQWCQESAETPDFKSVKKMNEWLRLNSYQVDMGTGGYFYVFNIRIVPQNNENDQRLIPI